MSKFVLSSSAKNLLALLVHDDEFKKLQYYMRSLKKAPHGGVFCNSHQSMYLQYYPIQTYTFIKKGQSIPYPVQLYKPKLECHITESKISIEELLVFCFCADENDNKDLIFGTRLGGDKLYCAMASGVLSLKTNTTDKYCFETLVMEAVNGQIKFTDCFNYDYSRLLEVFLLFTLRLNVLRFTTIDDVQKLEVLENNSDKYGLTDITPASFERQGFVIDNKFYLYNIFFDTSIGIANGDVPFTVDIIKNIPNVTINMRRDNTLAVPNDEKVTSATLDMQKWRGITLDLENIQKQIKQSKEVVVHWDPETRNKVLVIIKPSETETHEVYYQISVEELWSPDSIFDFEETVITNYIHGCYYPSENTFDHIDFSVNQYQKDLYFKKYEDSVVTTAVSIEQYANMHYKVWCIKGRNLSIQVWAELVNATLDQPFRGLFAEIIGAKLKEDE